MSAGAPERHPTPLFLPSPLKSMQKTCNRLKYYVMVNHINGVCIRYLYVIGVFIAEYQYSANRLIITITAMVHMPKPTFATWRGIFRPSKGGAILGFTGYR